ncbi:YBR124W-like protein [Saccharomyces kudriavzevii IFO 1802]|uniref:YBR124W-like protein n=1 Tax=Saccharomyces kudriavzevii (strain ATCC MYA-4449 / AS 2.2408 / CBS 8840 / NBRC 1802 / NCYC 2889) TaxID=226230 RepID=J6EI62_SACK1|nr:YBR124W-like protein [Saccharomyces kudriavzevii IFO 1802]
MLECFVETLSGNSKLGILGRSNVYSSAITGGVWSAVESEIAERVARGSSVLSVDIFLASVLFLFFFSQL